MNISLIYVFIAFQRIRDTNQRNRDLKVKNGKDLKWKLAAQSETCPCIASTWPYANTCLNTRPCLKAVSQKSKEHGHGTRPCSTMWTFELKVIHGCNNKTRPCRCTHAHVVSISLTFVSILSTLELLELWVGKNKKKKRTGRQKERYTSWNRAGEKRRGEPKDKEKRRKKTSNQNHLELFSLFLFFNSSSS